MRFSFVACAATTILASQTQAVQLSFPSFDAEAIDLAQVGDLESFE